MKRRGVIVLLLVALCAPAAVGEPAAASPGTALERLWTFLDSVVKLPLTWWETPDSRAAGSENEPPTEKGPVVDPWGLETSEADESSTDKGASIDPIGLTTIEPDEPPTEKGPHIDPIGLTTIEPDEPPTEKGPSSDPLG